eukprot:scaffold9776_cov117-Cylindrotheca_fusiformis.AAC.4
MDDANSATGSGLQSVAKDAATVSSFNTFNSFEGDRKPSDVSSQLFKSSDTLSSVLEREDSASKSFRSALRVDSRSSELKLVARSSNIQTKNS